MRHVAATQVSERDGGFGLEIRAVGGQTWSVPGNSKRHTVGSLKARLAAFDSRFSTHRADLVLGPAVLGDAETLGGCGLRQDSKLVCVFTDLRAAVLVIGGGVAGYRAVEDLSGRMPDQQIILVDSQEYFENASGLMRAFADPSSWEDIVVRHEDVIKRYENAQFVQGEVVSLRSRSATIESFLHKSNLTIRFKYCIVATGCSWAPRSVSGESLWRPSSLSATRKDSEWFSHDERTVSGRRKHINEVHKTLWNLSDRGGRVLVVGADYPGVEWACDLKEYFPGLSVAIADSVDRCLGSLPPEAARYAAGYMRASGIHLQCGIAYEPDSEDFWQKVGFAGKSDLTYHTIGVSARNGFMPAATLSQRGPGGGGWVLTNTYLQVCHRDQGDRPGDVWAGGRVFAVGDCQYGAVVGTSARKRETVDDVSAAFAIPPVPKTAMAAIYWAEVACGNIASLMRGWPFKEAGWPVIAGNLVVSLGSKDGVVASKITWARDSGEVTLTADKAAALKKRLSWPSEEEFLTTPSRWLAEFSDESPSSRGHILRGDTGVLRQNGEVR